MLSKGILCEFQVIFYHKKTAAVTMRQFYLNHITRKERDEYRKDA